ncbi:MAG: endopeptidase La [Pseudomonadota bacterium]|nr:endopeptidase La [Pseudomonadota bacterium]
MNEKMTTENIPLLPLRDVVVYPNMVVPLFVGRSKSIRSLEDSMNNYEKKILLVTQKSADIDDPNPSELYEIGCTATILQLLKLPDGTVKVLIEGISRSKIIKINDSDNLLSAECQKLSDTQKPSSTTHEDALARTLEDTFNQYVKLNKKIPPEVLSSIAGIDNLSKLSDSIAAHMTMSLDEKQKILELSNLKNRAEYLIKAMESELDILHVEKKIRGRVKQQMEKSQREYYLNEQMKAIQKELGDNDDIDDITEIEKKISEINLTIEARDKCKTELKKLKNMSPMSAEATVIRNYLDWVISIPWSNPSLISKNINKAKKILEADHYGLNKVKDRILEYLAVQKRINKIKGPILCLVGPPGVGKTSLGKSIANSTGRNFVRMSLGGIRDEAEIRGHRKTYIGSMPGRFIQIMKKSKSSNPLILLDEVDKLGSDWRGDPSSALLEVLDPEQNSKFNDHYLELDYDLSDVMFVCTANTLNIPPALLDRMETIRIPGYTEHEKNQIAKKYLVPKQQNNHGLKKKEISFSHSTINNIIRYYTREAGVRNLEKEIAKICRKSVKLLETTNKSKISLDKKALNGFLGVKRFRSNEIEKKNLVGITNGLAWTEVGGEILSIEVLLSLGKGKLTITGKLGDVMKESIQAAVSYVRSQSINLGINPSDFEKNDIHVHVPEGATPKDGPSAGIAIFNSLVSSLTSNKVKKDIAMTGEITLRGRVLPIGGLKEKLYAAIRAGIKKVLIPLENKKDLAEIDKKILKNIDIICINEAREILKHSLVKSITPLNFNESRSIKTLKSQISSENVEESTAH